ncbi:hypothetical protein [Brevibacterium spongiae]|uniref:Uncharacterized protein n=1 Tax=Brevibacterium spongiae TaxID=2909672 RepID=A0ABY5SMP6_9MICO|nr:hypothetical protein [Brevibacterium spongiae]UVI35390.1 hypothetical protein L1F31_14890 [Brevibacterium spongiae]
MNSSKLNRDAPSGTIDTAFVLKYEPLYVVTDLESELFGEIGPKTKTRESYKRKHFLKVAEWKAIGVLPGLEEIDSDDIEFVTAVALDDDTPNHFRLPLLQMLPGVGTPMASTLLAVVNPKKFSIMDSRALGVLHDFNLVPTDNPTQMDYRTYRKLMKSLAKGANCAPIDLYRALIAYSRQDRD